MKFRNIESCDSLIMEDPKIIQQSIIDYIIYLREELKLASTTINARVAAIRKFYDCNDIELRWKKIKSYVGRSRSKRNNGRRDRPYIFGIQRKTWRATAQRRCTTHKR